MAEAIITFVLEQLAGRFLDKILDHSTVANELMAAYTALAVADITALLVTVYNCPTN